MSIYYGGLRAVVGSEDHLQYFFKSSYLLMWGQVEHVLTMADLEKNTSLFTPRPNKHGEALIIKLFKKNNKLLYDVMHYCIFFVLLQFIQSEGN